MQRRTFIALGFGVTSLGAASCLPDKKVIHKLAAIQQNPLLIFKRLTLGFSLDIAADIMENGNNEQFQNLLINRENRDVPVNFEFDQDQTVSIGETWIDAVYRLDVFYEQYRKKSLRAWLVKELLSNKISLQNQMMLFWLNHFAISDVIEHKFEYLHIKLLHSSSFGNIKKLVKDVTIDPAMLRYLNGAENIKSSPNENYARELLELFTIGKGPQIGEGNYTTYTEEDVRECAKILTGWKDKGWFTRDEKLKPGAEFNPLDHDESVKKLSKSFNRDFTEEAAEDEFKKLIDVIFARKETALNFAKKLVTWFVGDEPQKYELLVCKIADILYDSDYEILPVMDYLTKSDLLGNTNHLRLKSPAQFVLGILHAIPVTSNNSPKQSNNFFYTIFKLMSEMGMELLRPPGVAGWKAYYQYPVLSKQWINASSQIKRTQFIKNLFFDGIEADDIKLKADMVSFLKQFKNQSIQQVIETAIYYFHPIYDERFAREIMEGLYVICDNNGWNKSLAENTYTNTQLDAVRQSLYTIVSQPQTNLI